MLTVGQDGTHDVHDLIRDTAVDLGLGLVRIQTDHGRIEDVFAVDWAAPQRHPRPRLPALHRSPARRERIARSLILTGFRNALRARPVGKSKALPFILLALNLFPAVIMVGVMVLIGLDELPIGGVRLDHMSPPRHLRRRAGTRAVLPRPAARHHLALPRPPLRGAPPTPWRAGPPCSTPRWCSWCCRSSCCTPTRSAARLHRADGERRLGLLFGLLLALSLTGIAGLIASWSTRRGFAVVATIAVLLIGNGIGTAIMGISADEAAAQVGEIAGLFSPYSLYRGSITAFADGTSLAPPPARGYGRLHRRLRRDLRGLPGRADLALPQDLDVMSTP